MAGTLIHGQTGHDLTTKEAQKGGINSGKTRKEKATFKKAVEWLLNSDYMPSKDGEIAKYFKDKGYDISKLNNTQLGTIGVMIGAFYGNANNFKALMEANEEIAEESTTTPTLKVEITDNSKLEKVMYEENQSGSNDEK